MDTTAWDWKTGEDIRCSEAKMLILLLDAHCLECEFMGTLSTFESKKGYRWKRRTCRVVREARKVLQPAFTGTLTEDDTQALFDEPLVKTDGWTPNEVELLRFEFMVRNVLHQYA